MYLDEIAWKNRAIVHNELKLKENQTGLKKIEWTKIL